MHIFFPDSVPSRFCIFCVHRLHTAYSRAVYSHVDFHTVLVRIFFLLNIYTENFLVGSVYKNTFCSLSRHDSHQGGRFCRKINIAWDRAEWITKVPLAGVHCTPCTGFSVHWNACAIEHHYNGSLNYEGKYCKSLALALSTVLMVARLGNQLGLP